MTPIAALLLSLLPLAQPPPGPDPWASLLGAAKLTPEQAQLDPGRWTGGGLYRLDEFQSLWNDWRGVDPTAIAWARESLDSAESLRRLAAFGALRLGVTDLPAPGPTGSRKRLSARAARAALLTAIGNLQTALGQPLDATHLDDLQARAAAVPAPTAEAAALVLAAVPEALRCRRKAFAAFGDESQLPAAHVAALKLAQQVDVDDTVLRLMDKVDLASLLRGGVALAETVDHAAVRAQVSSKEFGFEWDTPIGKIALNGGQANTYPAGAYLLVLDTGGDDHYGAGVAASSLATPVSVAIDLAGNDVYDASDGFAAGSGVLGYGLLLDAAGDDTYRGAGGLGTGIFGVGMLLDRSGKDSYTGTLLTQGAGVFGVGVLSDLAGDDSYQCLTQSQGYGGPRGVGVLADREGNDRYEADDTHITNPSPQTQEHNVSLAQGAGFGRRAHPGDGHSLAGGVGLLADGAGDDHYHCGVFGQGVAYWYSTGLLVDCGGNDTYEGVWYVQGSAAHYAVAALCDLGGNDHYHATMTQSEGQGHDYSLGLLHDAAGDDVYECPSNALGSGLWNGIGLFWDESGNDEYRTGAAALGFVGDSRPEGPCFGFFLDGGGNDTFPPDNLARPHSTWVRPSPDGHPLAHAAGRDG